MRIKECEPSETYASSATIVDLTIQFRFHLLELINGAPYCLFQFKVDIDGLIVVLMLAYHQRLTACGSLLIAIFGIELVVGGSGLMMNCAATTWPVICIDICT